MCVYSAFEQRMVRWYWGSPCNWGTPVGLTKVVSRMSQDQIKSWLTTGKVSSGKSDISFESSSSSSSKNDTSNTPKAAMERYLTWLESEVKLNKVFHMKA